MYPTLLFDVTLNDLKGGSATATVHADMGGGFAPIPPKAGYPGTAVYDPAVTTGEVWEGEIACAIDAPAVGGVRFQPGYVPVHADPAVGKALRAQPPSDISV